MRKKKFIFSNEPFSTNSCPEHYLLSQPSSHKHSNSHYSQNNSINAQTGPTTPIHHYSRSPPDFYQDPNSRSGVEMAKLGAILERQAIKDSRVPIHRK